LPLRILLSSFYIHAPPTTKTYTLSLHDALPIYARKREAILLAVDADQQVTAAHGSRLKPRLGPAAKVALILRPARSIWLPVPSVDRKSTRLNSSHVAISYAVFCLKKKIDSLLLP